MPSETANGAISAIDAHPRTVSESARPDGSDGSPLKIAMLAPPWIEVPPPAYGGIEQVVALLCEALVARGNDVTLFAAPGSVSTATVVSPLAESHGDEIGRSIFEADHVAQVFDALDQARAAGDPFDVVHDHSGFVAIAMADRLATPLVHTLHGPFHAETLAFYAAHGHRAAIVAISRTQLAEAPEALQDSAVVPNPIDVAAWPLRTEKEDYLLWMGRMDEVKGPHRAIEVARRCGRQLVLAGPVQPGQEAFFETEVRPHIDHHHIVYAGEVGGRDRVELFANADAFLMPISWTEPFGMVMVEALACGTPVLAYPCGAATEIVNDGENGFLVEDEAAMAAALDDLGAIDPVHCRESVASRYDADAVAAAYERVYRAQAAREETSGGAEIRTPIHGFGDRAHSH